MDSYMSLTFWVKAVSSCSLLKSAYYLLHLANIFQIEKSFHHPPNYTMFQVFWVCIFVHIPPPTPPQTTI